jgi:tetratricopeptide (TPR) repeat protein
MAEERPARARRALPARPNLEHLRKEAKQRLKLLRAADPAAKLAEAQREVAREYGFPSWRRLASQFRPTETAANGPEDYHFALARLREAAEDHGDWTAVEEGYRGLIARNPGDSRLQADFAILLTQTLGKQEEARGIFRRLLQKPTPEITALFSWFARMVDQVDLDQQEAILRRAVACGDNPLAFNHYANFLWKQRDDRDGAERWFRKAAELDSGDPLMDGMMRGIYATVLWEWGDPVSAETWFRLGLSRTRMDLQSPLAFAALLTAEGRADEGLALVREALDHPRLKDIPRRTARAFELLCWFLRYAHGDVAIRDSALAEIRARFEEPSRSGRFVDLGRNARAAAAAGHPAADLVAALANALQPDPEKAEAAFEDARRCPAWRG